MKCTALLTCEKIIVDKEGAHSIINVMMNAAVSLQKRPPGEVAPSPSSESVPIPANAASPNQWWIYAAWAPSPDDVGKSFKQVYQVLWPNGDKFAESKLPFTQNTDQMQQTTFYILGLPIGQEGRVRVRTWLDSEGERVSEISETFIDIKHGIPDSMDQKRITAVLQH